MDDADGRAIDDPDSDLGCMNGNGATAAAAPAAVADLAAIDAALSASARCFCASVMLEAKWKM